MDAAADVGAAWCRWMVWRELVLVSFLGNPPIYFYETLVESFLMTNTNPPVAGDIPHLSIVVIGEGRSVEERGRTSPAS